MMVAPLAFARFRAWRRKLSRGGSCVRQVGSRFLAEDKIRIPRVRARHERNGVTISGALFASTRAHARAGLTSSSTV
jgi:hypothetical protein